MKLKPILNPDHAPSGDMFKALNWLETRCSMRGIHSVTEQEVREFLEREEWRPDLAADFDPRYLIPLPDDAQ